LEAQAHHKSICVVNPLRPFGKPGGNTNSSPLRESTAIRRRKIVGGDQRFGISSEIPIRAHLP
jgi:hypothetical protein